MRANIQDAFEAYVAELTRYREWMDETRAKYGQKAPNHWEWGDHDFQRAETWDKSLKAVREVLDLTKEEDAEADRRAGIQQFPSEPEPEGAPV